ncbi:MAG: Holliday junction branch migration protein RuvA [Oligoflexia bacterium]|nr:Holliday junction branch migration protein RuvA [Oligoflexia bacterium]
MIGHLKGEVLFSDGVETIIQTHMGIGYQVYLSEILTEGAEASVYISHVIKEAGEELYGFKNLREKKLFEILISVKGVGPKSAFVLLNSLGVDQIVTAIQFDNKKALTAAPGIGPKAAAQILLDLSSKIDKIKMYSPNYQMEMIVAKTPGTSQVDFSSTPMSNDNQIFNDALMACKELGFKEDEVMNLATKIMQETQISKSEQLVHLVLKEM